MLTPKEVSEHAFTKAALGGYNMKQVDDFLDELTDDYAALFKENAALKAKMKVLVEKVDEYRATEDSMRQTLLTAQRTADSIIREAEEKKEQILTQAEIDAKLKINRLRAEAEENAARLRQGQEDLRAFIASASAVCEKELALLKDLPDLPVQAVSAAAESVEPESDPVEDTFESIEAAFRTASSAAEAAEEPAPAEESASVEPSAAAEDDMDFESDPFGVGDLDATRPVNLEDLKFGRNGSKKD